MGKFLVVAMTNIHLKFSALRLLFCIFIIKDLTTTIATPNPPPSAQCQEEMDAQAIVDSQMKPEIIAGILPYRNRCQCIAINTLITAKNGGKYFITDNYIYTPVPEGENPPFKDLCFGLVKDKGIVLSGYLSIFFEAKDETKITIVLVLNENMDFLKTTYDMYHEDKFGDMVDKQRCPYQNMLKKWIEKSREPDEPGDLDHANVVKDANDLKKEQEGDGCWGEDRDVIETILMKKSLKYARAVIDEFEKSVGGKAIEIIIDESLDRCDLNHDLVDAYSSLARSIKDRPKYIADTMRQYSNGTSRWAEWILCIAVVNPPEWGDINKALQKDNPDESLSKLVLKGNTQDKVMAEMMAAIVDPTFKPTTFESKPETTESSAPPPVQPTTLAPPPAPVPPPPAPVTPPPTSTVPTTPPPTSKPPTTPPPTTTTPTTPPPTSTTPTTSPPTPLSPSSSPPAAVVPPAPTPAATPTPSTGPP